MSYQKADHILPPELLEKVQEYIDGELIYIPKTAEHKKSWGEGTQTRKELKIRNAQIYEDYLNGENMERLAIKYYLSYKSIQRIISHEKKSK